MTRRDLGGWVWTCCLVGCAPGMDAAVPGSGPAVAPGDLAEPAGSVAESGPVGADEAALPADEAALPADEAALPADEAAPVADPVEAVADAPVIFDATDLWESLTSVGTPDRGMSWADDDNPIVGMGSVVCTVGIGDGLIFQDFSTAPDPYVHGTFMGEGLISERGDQGVNSRRLFRHSRAASVDVGDLIGAQADDTLAAYTERTRDGGCAVHMLDGSLRELGEAELDDIACDSEAAIAVDSARRRVFVRGAGGVQRLGVDDPAEDAVLPIAGQRFAYAGADDVLVAVNRGNRWVHAVNGDGEVIWSLDTDGAAWDVAATPTRIFIGAQDRDFQGFILSVDPRTGDGEVIVRAREVPLSVYVDPDADRVGWSNGTLLQFARRR